MEYLPRLVVVAFYLVAPSLFFFPPFATSLLLLLLNLFPHVGWSSFWTSFLTLARNWTPKNPSVPTRVFSTWLETMNVKNSLPERSFKKKERHSHTDKHTKNKIWRISNVTPWKTQEGTCHSLNLDMGWDRWKPRD